MAFIVQRFNDYRLQLGREEIIRPMSFGTSWGALRIAMLCTVNGGSGAFAPAQQTTITGLYPLSMGLTQGNVGILTDNTVDALYGAFGLSGASWTPTATGNNFYYQLNGAINPFQKIGGTITTIAPNSNQGSAVAGDSLQSSGGSLFRMPINLDIIKTSLTTPTTNYTMSFYSPTSAQLGDVPEDTWFDRIQTYGQMTNTSQNGSVTFQPSGNLLHDSVFIAWNRLCPVLEISAWAVIRFD